MVSERKVRQFQEKILCWYKINKRDLPWRKTKDPYKILVSEIMLQQTQVDRVIDYYKRFLKELPNLKALAKADKRTLLELWSGLGYNNRVLRLQKLAQALHKRKIPNKEEELISLPGIGPYTAHAVMAFAFNKEVPVMDTNIRRVLIHELKLHQDISIQGLKNIALAVIPKGKSCIWHNALMDYGATVLTARKTGIKPLSKQSKFEGSDRQVRGTIVKLLLKEKKLSIAKLKKEFDEEKVSRVLNKMEKEEIIKRTKSSISLS